MKTIYFGFCPNCEKETQQIHVTGEKVTIDVKGVPCTVGGDYFICDKCHEEYDAPGYDVLEAAYIEWERITGQRHPFRDFKGVDKDG